MRQSLGLFPVSIALRALRGAWKPRTSIRPPRARFNSTAPLQAVGASPNESPEPPAIVLRDYQEDCIQSVLGSLRQGHKRLGVSLATGAGKTVVFTQLIGRIPPRNGHDKTMIIVHRRELVEQAARHCRLAYPDRTVEIEMGNTVATGSGDIIIASIRSLTSKDRIEKFDPKRFKLILVDEAHHIVAPSYRVALAHFDLNEPSPNSPALVGVSATFSRFDGLKLGAAIDHIVYHKDYMDMIDEKWLSNAVFTTVRSQANLSKVKKDRFGDFALGSLSEAVNTTQTNDITVRAWLANARERKSTLVFCVDVEHTKQLTEAFRAVGIDARYITAKTPREKRDEQLRAFRNQEYAVLLNCGLFTEGTDIPNIDCVLLARPTRSRNLLTQMIGRGLRLHPGKKDCHIIDMVATLETGVLSVPTLFGLHPDEILKEEHARDLRGRKYVVPVNSADPDSNLEPTAANTETSENLKITFTKYDTIHDLIHDMKTDKHIRSLSRYAWVRVGEHKYVLSDSTGWLALEKENSPSPPPSPPLLPKRKYKTKKKPDPPQPHYTVSQVTKFRDLMDLAHYTRPRVIATAEDFESAVRAADTFAASEFDERYISTRQSWRHSPATDAQTAMLNKANIRDGLIKSGDLTRGQAADLITKLKFGGKNRFAKKRKERRAEEDRARGLEELRKRGEVRVGPLDS
ncbi:P-loop containing nucleoside triphosphate hydrolase protein [Aspergillus heteromorphus CBS 117.55]|uniref:P-loop containing nucleoside triphosphate hydrolase protein n=1 Tax=Aspergillus heteromorphus CBS 117.55 TaxID=1448321 RepID=A0A317X297_9EURO|nr:P-loop containing nucleoside triphosphate hydrolase protein [Aspergillus heteromorphus CBS 117.55]PWY90670.1 P-loop containing nucleoside triphosphate hydrolase protein [Aspergillus heteromorphus CBS 117.55]